jgi:ParB/RepB/Spo0J family partition protein
MNEEVCMAKKNPDLQGSAGGSPGQDGVNCRALLISEIRVEGQGDDLYLEGESYERLVNSIREVGVLEPILVMQLGDSYQLVCGEHRLEACRRLGLTSIPARILDSTLSRSEVLECKMIENLNRAEMNPIREAGYYLEYLKSKLGVKDEHEAINILETYGRGRKGSLKTFAETVSTLERISGKTSRSIQNYLRLLLLPDVIKRAVIEEKISVSKGYIFAQYIHHPELLPIFQMSLQRLMSNRTLKGYFDDQIAESSKKDQVIIRQLWQHISRVESCIEDQHSEIKPEEAERMMQMLNGLCQRIEKKIGTSNSAGAVRNEQE